MKDKTAYINDILLSGEKDIQPVSGQILFTEYERIEKILPDGADTDGYEIVDLNGAYLMPGLVNLHVHIPATGAPKKKQTDPKKLVRLLTSNALMRRICYSMCGKYVLPELLSGVTTLRSVGGVLDIDSRLRDPAGTWPGRWPMRRTQRRRPRAWCGRSRKGIRISSS